MNLRKLRDDLRRFVHDESQRHFGPHAELDRLIVTLEKKDADLRQRLAMETDPLKRRHLKIELKVTRMQHDKGVARRQELQGGHA